MTDTATVDLSEAATVVVPPPKAEVPVLGRDDIVASPPDGGKRAAELLDGLIAWHNRMPWAKRLRPEQVGQAGVVRFAFEAPHGGSGDAMLLKPLFKPEKLVAGQSAKQLLAFVRRHGLDASPAPADWPLRELAPAGGGDAAVHWRYLLSAAYPGAYGTVPLRALMGQPAQPGGKVPVGGWRGLSLPRVGGALGLVAGLALAAVIGLRQPAPDAAAVAPAPAASAASAVSAKAATSAAVPASAAASQAELVEAAAAAEAASAPASAAEALAPVTPTHDAVAPAAVPTSQAHAGTVPSPTSPVADSAAAGHGAPAKTEHAEPAAPEKPDRVVKAPEPVASQAAPAAEHPLPKPRPTIRPIHTPVEAYDPVAQASARANGKPEPVAKAPSFALVTAVSEQPEPLVQLRRRLRQAMGREGEDLKLELQPAPGGQVLALWPIPSRDSATRLADTLRQAGIRMRVVEF